MAPRGEHRDDGAMTDSESTDRPERDEKVPDDGFPGEDVMPDDPDPDLDVTDPFGVRGDREPLEGEPDDTED